MTEQTSSPGSGQGAMEGAKQQAQKVADRAQEQAQEVAGQARTRTRGMVDERSTQAGERISAQAEDARAVAAQLREQGKEGPAKLAEQAAERADRVGSYLRRSDADRLLGDVERVARDNPWAVVAGGIVLGFAASRFLKASSRERYRSSQGGPRDARSLTARTPTAPTPATSPGAPDRQTAGAGAATQTPSPVGGGRR